jgi:hypothetical protein
MFGIGKKKPVMTTKQEVIDAMTTGLESSELKYKFDQEKSLFTTSFMGDDLPIGVNILIDDVAAHFILFLDLKAAPENYKTVAWDLNCLNKKLVFGSFYLDPEDGMITLEYGFPYLEARVSPDFLISFVGLLVRTVDEHDGDLKQLAENTVKDTMYG